MQHTDSLQQLGGISASWVVVQALDQLHMQRQMVAIQQQSDIKHLASPQVLDWLTDAILEVGGLAAQWQSESAQSASRQPEGVYKELMHSIRFFFYLKAVKIVYILFRYLSANKSYIQKIFYIPVLRLQVRIKSHNSCWWKKVTVVSTHCLLFNKLLH